MKEKCQICMPERECIPREKGREMVDYFPEGEVDGTTILLVDIENCLIRWREENVS